MGTRNSYFLLITFSFFLSGNNYAQEQQVLKTRDLLLTGILRHIITAIRQKERTGSF